MKCRLLLVFIFLFAESSFAQWIADTDFDVHSKNGINSVYNLEFEKAEKEFQYLADTYPQHPAGKFFLAMADWWRIMLDVDNESLDAQFIKKLEVVIDMCDSLLDINSDDVTALFFKGGALGFRGRLYANRGSWIKAANDGRMALPIVQHAFKIAPENFDILLGIGIYNYYAETIPEKYPLVKPLMVFFPSGDKHKGIRQLTTAALRAQYASVEASYFLLQLYYSYERQLDKALEIANALHVRFPNNVVVHRYIGRCYVSQNKWEEARAVFTEIFSRCNNGMTGYTTAAKREAYYYFGLCAMNKNQFDEALQNFYLCDELSRALDKDGESGFMVMTNLRIGMVYDIQQKRQYAVQQYNKVLKMKKFENARDLAEQYLRSAYIK